MDQMGKKGGVYIYIKFHTYKYKNFSIISMIKYMANQHLSLVKNSSLVVADQEEF